MHVSTHSIDAECNFAELEFEVRDTGIGMSSEEISRLFMPFSQGDSSTTRKYGGTGLGLAICKSLSEAMGGKVWATSMLREGSSFFSRVRVDVVEMSDTHSLSFESEKLKVISTGKIKNKEELDKPANSLPLKIAVAEDNMANQRVIMIMLRRLGWESEFAENGRELLYLVRNKYYALVFMDIQMYI